MITLEQAKNLKYGQVLEHTKLTNADKTPMRFVIKGAAKTWKRNKDRIRIPLKRGLYEFGELTNGTSEKGGYTLNLNEVNLSEYGRS